jgi:hypothetical protein
MTTIWFQQCRLEIDYPGRFLRTIFTDGTSAPARPNYAPSDIERAYDCGYAGDTWLLTLDHEPLHTWVAEHMGQPYSLVLWETAHGNLRPKGGRDEEGYVMAVQRFLRRGVTDDPLYGFFQRAEETTGQRIERVVREARTVLSEAHRGCG